MIRPLLLIAVLLAGTSARAQDADRPTAPPSLLPGSAVLCLYGLPGKEGTTRYLNLAIVQHIELTKERVRLTYGGGNFGSGYDIDITVKSRDEGLDLIRHIQQTARDCARHAGMGMRGMSVPVQPDAGPPLR